MAGKRGEGETRCKTMTYTRPPISRLGTAWRLSHGATRILPSLPVLWKFPGRGTLRWKKKDSLPIFTFALSLTDSRYCCYCCRYPRTQGEILLVSRFFFLKSFHEKNSFRFSPATSFLLPSRSRTDFDSSRENKGKREKERERDRQKDIIARAGGHYHVEC